MPCSVRRYLKRQRNASDRQNAKLSHSHREDARCCVSLKIVKSIIVCSQSIIVCCQFTIIACVKRCAVSVQHASCHSSKRILLYRISCRCRLCLYSLHRQSVPVSAKLSITLYCLIILPRDAIHRAAYTVMKFPSVCLSTSQKGKHNQMFYQLIRSQWYSDGDPPNRRRMLVQYEKSRFSVIKPTASSVIRA